MTANEALEYLISLDIVLLIGDEYHITEKYKDFFKGETRSPLPKKVSKSALNNIQVKSIYPKTVTSQTGRARAMAFMEFCEVPIYSNTATKYRLRSLDNDCINIVDNLVIKFDEYEPNVIVEVIKTYYANTEMPKAFKNLVNNDLFQMYVEHLSGNSLSDSTKKKDNQKWD